MPTPPTREEIEKEFKAVLDRIYGPVTEETELPTSIQCQREGISLQIIGYIKGWLVVAKRNVLKTCVGAILFYGEIRQSADYLIQDSKFAYQEASKILVDSYQRLDLPATEFATFAPPENWPIPPIEPIRLTWMEPPVSTTTTPPPRISITATLPSGSGLVPRPSSGNYYS